MRGEILLAVVISGYFLRGRKVPLFLVAGGPKWHTMCIGNTTENRNLASNKDWQKVCIYAEARKYRLNAGMFELNIYNTRGKL